MVKFKKNRKAKVISKTRKEIRKEKRLVKKQNKQQFFAKKNSTKKEEKSTKNIQNKNENDQYEDDEEIESDFDISDDEMNAKIPQKSSNAMPTKKIKKPPQSQEDQYLESRKRELKNQKELERKMHKKRIHQLKEANDEEDKIIKKLEKKLNINKHHNDKTVHKMFGDGLDYALELCLPENIKKMYSAAKEAAELSEDDFQEDLAAALGKPKKQNDLKKSVNVKRKVDDNERTAEIKSQKKLKKIESRYLGEESDFSGSDSEFEGSDNDDDISNDSQSVEESIGEDDNDSEDLESLDSNDDSSEKGDDLDDLVEHIDSGFSGQNDKEDNDSDNESEIEDEETNDSNHKDEDAKAWEDIYGRKRDVDGNVLEKYVPPHMKAKMTAETGEDLKRKQKLELLKKHCKGFLNRLSEQNMHKISSEIENLYRNNARFDMNNTLTQLTIDALVSNVLSNERMVLEHTMLVAILHTNVGSEVGAHFLQAVIDKFQKLVTITDILDIENKELDNICLILSHLYTFKIFQHALIFEIMDKIIEKLNEKSIECLLLILRSVGFQLRKDDPIALKNLILSIQKKAQSSQVDISKNPRFKFMVEILNAIKNNNMTKIPNYQPELAEHLKKILKSMFTNGKYLSTLNITMEDLLKADEKGKWWVVGSAWTGNIKDIGAAKSSNQSDDKSSEKFSEKLLKLAKQQRMNTEDRRNVFCILMSAEDFLSAFERLLHLALKDLRIIPSIIIHCCLSEKQFNPYYAALAQKFSDYDRKYKIAVQFAVWDRIKELHSLGKQEIKNLAQFLIYLIMNGGQPISILKVIEFAELDKISLRIVRQIFLGILLGKENEFQQVFEKITPSMKLKNFKDSIRLFMNHFLLKGMNESDIPNQQLDLLKKRISSADSILEFTDSKLRF